MTKGNGVVHWYTECRAYRESKQFQLKIGAEGAEAKFGPIPDGGGGGGDEGEPPSWGMLSCEKEVCE